MTIVGHVSQVFRYPVKSLRGHALDAAAIGARGIEGDRRWMIVDETGRFLTRRELPELALFDVQPREDGLLILHPERGTCCVATPGEDAVVIEARVWRDGVRARLADRAAGAFLSGALGRAVRLVHQHGASVRRVDPTYARDGDHVSLADGFPLLVTTTASLSALNDRLPVAIGMDRFRPNLVIGGAEAWGEDRWRRIRIGGVALRIAKPCSRCVITTQHPLTGRREHGDDPLSTLRAMGRMTSGGIMFGQNAIPDRAGAIRLGDAVELIEAGESNLV